MPNPISVEQNAAIGSHVTQIGVQNNGLTPKEASQMAIDLFMDNFPKLKQIAADTARERAEEFVQIFIEKLQKENIEDFSALSDPDVQCVLYEAQKNYARMGTENRLQVLTDLVQKRVTCNKDFVLNVTIDRAVSVVGMLSPNHLDLLSLMFMSIGSVQTQIKTIEELKNHLESMCRIFDVAPTSHMVRHLVTAECMVIQLTNPVEILSKSYHFPEQDIELICPERIKKLRGDFGPSSIGKLLAIINIKNKMGLNIPLEYWIHE